jgi:endo-1,4-beta-xylanase
MSIRSLLTTGLLAASVLAGPPGYGNTKTVTVTDTKTVVHDHTKTVTETKKVVHDHTTTVTKTKTKTTSATVTDTITAAASCTSSSSSSKSSSGSTTSSASSSSSSVSTTSSSSTNTNPTTTIVATATATNYGLNDAAKAAGKLWFGTAFDYPGTGEAQDPYYAAQFNNTHDFGEATPANIMKFEFTEPEQNVFNFTGGDEFIAYTKPTKEYIRCHNLIWQSELSDWVTAPAVNWTNATLTAALRNHVTKVIEHFGDECYSWDVVNEALSDNPAGAYQQNIWYNTIGPAYVVEAFDAATQAVKANNLNVKLYYNDYNIEYPGNKSIGAQNIVKDLKARGIQIDGVGFESHFIVSLLSISRAA